MEPGLRERKRVATRRAIQVAAIGLVAEHGLERLTVDEIGRVADISPRTFFNYFPTKEAALIGDAPSLPGDDVVTAFIEGGATEDLLSGLVRLFSAAIELVAEDRELTQLRRSVLKRYPNLFAMRILTMHEFQADVQGVIARRLSFDDPGLSDDEVSSRASLTMHVAVGAMRHAWLTWSNDAEGSDLTVRLRESFDMLETLVASPAIK
jgi:AcrR family transcriptional regulator